jgi:hypothetical protein
MTRPDWTLPGIDVNRPNAARIYDYNLGGSHNFAIDRQTAEQLNKAMPDFPRIQRASRAFLRRVVQFLVGTGIRQFLDLGSGIPTVGNVHEIAQRAAPASRVVYVDVDPVAVVHSRAILADNDLTAAIQADVRHAAGILTDPAVRSLLDFTRPVAVLMVSVLHFIADEEDPLRIVGAFRDAMCPGSYLAISHATTEGSTSDQIRAGVRIGRKNRVESTMRGRVEVARMFEGFEILEPGVVFTPQWRPDSPGEDFSDAPGKASLYGGVGIKR